MSYMEIASVRLNPNEKKFLDKLVKEGIYKSVSDALKAGIYQLINDYKQKQLPWKNRDEVREYFGKKTNKIHGLEDLHVEEDERVP